MTDKTPPIKPGNIRVIVNEGAADSMVADLPTAHLPGLAFLAGLSDLTSTPLVPGSMDGARAAREIFSHSRQSGNGLVACTAALWICLYGPPYLPDLALSVDDLHAAAGAGSIRISVSGDFATWDYSLDSPAGTCNGRKILAGDLTEGREADTTLH